MPSTASLLLGIDGGGTKTECYLVRCTLTSGAPDSDFAVIGKGFAGPSNPRSIGMESATAALDEAVAAAFRDARCERTSVHSCAIGLAGAGREEIRGSVADWAGQRCLAAIIHVVPDFELPLAAAPDEVGIALISGTGSVAFGRNPRGDTARTGGWGYLLGDAGSAYAIGRAGLEAACLAEDGCGLATELTTTIPQHFGVASLREVADRIYASSDSRQTIAATARVVFSAGRRDDRPACTIVAAAQAALSQMIGALAGKLKLNGQPFTLALAGSVLVKEREFAERIVAGLADWCDVLPRPTFVPDPVLGAVHMARRRLLRQEPADRGVPRAGG